MKPCPLPLVATLLERLSRIASSELPNAALVGINDQLSVGDVREIMRLLADRDGWVRAAGVYQEQIRDAETALGRAWMYGGVSLADGIRRKTAAMERIAMPTKRKRPGATLTVEHEDGSADTTTYGGDR